MSANIPDTSFDKLKSFFAKPVVHTGTEPLRTGIEIAIYIDGCGPATITKEKEGVTVKVTAPNEPDMSFWVTSKGLERLNALETDDVGDVGVEILKLMASAESDLKLKAKVHIGAFTLLRNGYLSVLPLGGATVMKFLASKGLTNIGKIKDAINSLKG